MRRFGFTCWALTILLLFSNLRVTRLKYMKMDKMSTFDILSRTVCTFFTNTVKEVYKYIKFPLFCRKLPKYLN